MQISDLFLRSADFFFASAEFFFASAGSTKCMADLFFPSAGFSECRTDFFFGSSGATQWMADFFRRFTADLKAHHGLDSAGLIRYGLLPKGRPRKATKKKEEVTAKARVVEAGKVDSEVAPA